MFPVYTYFLLLAFARSSYSLLCYSCGSYGDVTGSCRWGSSQCPSDFKCSSTIYQYYNDIDKEEGTYTYIINYCIPSTHCDFIGSYSYGKETTWIVTACCDTDYCIPDIPAEIRTSNEPSGVTCPICSSYTSMACEPTGSMQCRGDEYKCVLFTLEYHVYYDEKWMEEYWYGSGAVEYFNYTGKVPFWLTKVSQRGCATDSVCSLGIDTAAKPLVFEERTFTCTGGTDSYPSFYYTLILCCFGNMLLYHFVL